MGQHRTPETCRFCNIHVIHFPTIFLGRTFESEQHLVVLAGSGSSSLKKAEECNEEFGDTVFKLGTLVGPNRHDAAAPPELWLAFEGSFEDDLLRLHL